VISKLENGNIKEVLITQAREEYAEKVEGWSWAHSPEWTRHRMVRNHQDTEVETLGAVGYGVIGAFSEIFNGHLTPEVPLSSLIVVG